ncbi:MAG: GNAT family N-acetyltransferase [Roseibium sp.]|uniref:GNAT family N-acetyltransferase n=1 Tax=Roseibium sp. TaxID=1936156 RepID=UPI001B169E41|nr:GNAT family N-acetyltransferase [Roseibium sp.]MBO6894148.1 GNAT family N-acetyltransferase [Roseibium sp.]MBO6930694.1 GNAT family N-acetyltransferase [Roseibium sp.]
MPVIIRPTEEKDHADVHQLLTERWTAPEIMLDDDMVDASRLPGYVAYDGDELVGLVTLIKRDGEWEILTLDSINRWGGVGSQLLDAVSTEARQLNVPRLTVRTSNDNLDAFRFYQRRGFRLEKIGQGVIDRERELKPGIPLRGDYGIEIHDEVLFARTL